MLAKFVTKCSQQRLELTHTRQDIVSNLLKGLSSVNYVTNHIYVRTNLLDHKRVKHDAQRFVCNLCGKVLTRSQTLRQHMKTHDK